MKLRDCESCLVYGSDKKPLSRARVFEVSENVLRLFFTTPKLRSARLKTIVDFYDGQHGLVRCLCDMALKKNPAAMQTGEPWMADCTLVKVYEAFQRQKDVRVKVQIALDFRADDNRMITGTVQNISAGGLYFVTTQKLVQGQYITFVYKFKSEPHRVTAKVLRVQELRGGGFGYGCQFLELTPGQEADIRNFVYVRQIQGQLERQKRHNLPVDAGL